MKGVFFGLGFEILVGVLVFFQLLGFFVCLIIDIRIPASTVWAGLFKVIFIPFYNFKKNHIYSQFKLFLY